MKCRFRREKLEMRSEYFEYVILLLDAVSKYYYFIFDLPFTRPTPEECNMIYKSIFEINLKSDKLYETFEISKQAVGKSKYCVTHRVERLIESQDLSTNNFNTSK